ncbi:UPF0182 family protein [Nocardioides conyzicola]|uniref:Helix-turn-helix domain-containing protein n=1 Tax=Nocardioides conyzicola TaxID=1651781 RepID=A0ABP8WY16_9ACTN
MEDEFSVAEAAEALGTSPQTVRTLLRKGELGGERKPWGSRFVWVVPRQAVDAFLAEHGRLEGRRRAPREVVVRSEAVPEPDPDPAPESAPELVSDSVSDPVSDSVSDPDPTPVHEQLPEPVVEQLPPVERRRRRLPFFLRVRGRATVVVLVVGLPALIAYLYARVIPGALWFEELGQGEVFRRLIEARVDFHLRVMLVAAAVVAVNLFGACHGTRLVRRFAGRLAIVAISLALGNLFASAATSRLSTYLLWRHRQSFGEVDPLHGRDVSFFVFSLPFYLDVAVWLLSLLGVTSVIVLVVYVARGRVGLRPLRVRPEARIHLAGLAAAVLLVVAWRLQLQQYVLELGQPSSKDSHSFAGAGYVDVNVTIPILRALAATALVLAVLCLLAPVVARTRFARAGRLFVLGSVVGFTALGALIGAVAPIIVQRYVVDPNPLVTEKPYLASSLRSTQAALGLDEIDVRSYEPEGTFNAADFADSRQRFSRVPTWDTYILGARMRQLVTEPPYFSPDDPQIDVVRSKGKRQLTAVSARELDLNKVPSEGDTWVSNRLSYTHGLGLIRFSSTDVGDDREPRLLDSGLGVTQPRIYFGNLPRLASDDDAPETQVRLLKPTLDEDVADSQWVVANTRRPEVDIPATQGAAGSSTYHYDGSGGIKLSSSARRAVFALALGSKELLLSEEITPDSRLLLHRDVHDRLKTLAPFIHWDSEAMPLTANGHVVFVVDGYTTSTSYPYAQKVALGHSQVNYARASVVATVDAFDGKVSLYVTDDDEPVLRAWREIFPSLFKPFSSLPDKLRGRLRYPAELFNAQSTAYERYHTTRADVFVSGADTWARPLALSGPIEVAGDVDFDESDEDDLRLTMPPVYIWIPPTSGQGARVVLATYYTPSQGQNLVGSLNGWIDDDGQARLIARGLPRDPVTLGPAQVSRLVFATPRVSNLLGLRNLEIRDLDKSSIDAVLLGRPRIMLLRGGLVQVQNLYEGSRGPGAARLLGVTAYVNGRAGLGPDVESAVRQALNEPPEVELAAPDDPPVVGEWTDLDFRVVNARQEDVTITSATGRVRARLKVASGTGSVRWLPTEPGETRVRISVVGLDGTRTSDVITVEVLGPAPRLQLLDLPTTGEVGKPVRVRFEVANGVTEVAEVSTRAGIVFQRKYEVRDGRGVVAWVPDATGASTLVVRVRGTEGQVVRQKLRIEVGPSTAVMPPTVTITKAPRSATVGEAARFDVRASGCQSVLAQLSDDDGTVLQEWRFACPADAARVVWTPAAPGDFTFTVIARGGGASSQMSVPVTVLEPV